MERREFLQKGLMLGAATTLPASAVGASSALFDVGDAICEQTKRSIIEAAAKSDVVLTNGLIAVGLRFDQATMDSPIITAKGENSLARLIRETAAEHGVFIIEFPWLAECLFKDTEIDGSVPEITFRAIAEVFTFVQRQNNCRAFRDYLVPEKLDIYIGVDLLPLADPSRGGDLLDRVHRLRKEVASEIGIICPRIRIRDSVTLGQTEYEFCIDGQSIDKGSVYPDRYLAIDDGKIAEKLDGIEVIEPAYGTPALWIEESVKEQAQIHGYTAVEPNAFIIAHFLEVIRKYADQVLTVNGTLNLLDTLEERSPVLVGVVLELLDIGLIHSVLQLLLKEQIPIKRLETILDVLLEHCEQTKDPMILCKHVRQRLAVLDKKLRFEP